MWDFAIGLQSFSCDCVPFMPQPLPCLINPPTFSNSICSEKPQSGDTFGANASTVLLVALTESCGKGHQQHRPKAVSKSPSLRQARLRGLYLSGRGNKLPELATKSDAYSNPLSPCVFQGSAPSPSAGSGGMFGAVRHVGLGPQH